MNLHRSAILLLSAGAVAGALVGQAPAANADTVAYVVNVTLRPGYNFANAEQAVVYGYGICDKIASGKPFVQLVGEVQNDFNIDPADNYSATYLISQAAQELCPAQIYQLRKSAAHYQGQPGA